MGVVIWNPRPTSVPTMPVPRADRKIVVPGGAEVTEKLSKVSVPSVQVHVIPNYNRSFW